MSGYIDWNHCKLSVLYQCQFTETADIKDISKSKRSKPFLLSILHEQGESRKASQPIDQLCLHASL